VLCSAAAKARRPASRPSLTLRSSVCDTPGLLADSISRRWLMAVRSHAPGGASRHLVLDLAG